MEGSEEKKKGGDRLKWKPHDAVSSVVNAEHQGRRPEVCCVALVATSVICHSRELLRLAKIFSRRHREAAGSLCDVWNLEHSLQELKNVVHDLKEVKYLGYVTEWARLSLKAHLGFDGVGWGEKKWRG